MPNYRDRISRLGVVTTRLVFNKVDLIMIFGKKERKLNGYECVVKKCHSF